MAIIHSNRHGGRRPPILEQSTAASDGADRGYTLVELLLVIGLLGVLVSAAWLVAGGMSTEAADTGCDADERVLYAAVQLYLGEHDTIIPTGTDRDRFERTLVTAGYLRAASQFHDLTADGSITPEVPSC